jgi:hypothetical protein
MKDVIIIPKEMLSVLGNSKIDEITSTSINKGKKLYADKNFLSGLITQH